MEIEYNQEEHTHLLPAEIKYNIVLLKRQGLTDAAAAREIFALHGRQVHPASVKRVWLRYQRTHNVENEWNLEGRPQTLTDDDRNRIEEAVVENRIISCEEIKEQLELDVSAATINRELHSLGYHAYKPIEKPFLSPSNIQQRLEFAQAHEDWDFNDWSQVIFSDESAFNVLNADGRTFVWRKPDEITLLENFQLVDQFPKTILVWGAISLQGCGPLVRVEGTLTGDSYFDLFRHRLRRFYPRLYSGDQIFQDDNAPPHRAGVVRDWFQKYEITRLTWPSKSPDLNLIEGVWGHIKHQLRGRVFADRDELWAELLVEWNAITPEFIRNLYESLPRRIQAVITADGGHTTY